MRFLSSLLRRPPNIPRLREKRDVESLISALSNESPETRSLAAQALAELGDSRAVEPLIGLLGDQNPVVQTRAALALGALRDPRAAGPLAETLGKVEGKSCEEAVQHALVELEDLAIAPVATLLDDKANFTARPWVAFRALEVLGNLRGDEAGAVLRRLVETVPHQHKGAASTSLASWLVEAGRLDAALSHDNERVRYAAAWRTVPDSHPRAFELLTDAAETDSSIDVRVAAIGALPNFGNRAFSVLIHALGSEMGRVRAAAAAALGHVGNSAAVGPLSELLSDPYSATHQKVVRMGARIDDVYEVESYPVREAAAEALEKIGGPDAQRALTAAPSREPKWRHAPDQGYGVG